MKIIFETYASIENVALNLMEILKITTCNTKENNQINGRCLRYSKIHHFRKAVIQNKSACYADLYGTVNISYSYSNISFGGEVGGRGGSP